MVPRVLMLEDSAAGHAVQAARQWSKSLPVLGYAVELVTQPQALYQRLEVMGVSSSLVVILGCEAHINLAVLSYLRAHYPVLPVLAVVPGLNSVYLAQALGAGADMYCCDTADASLLALMLARLVARTSGAMNQQAMSVPDTLPERVQQAAPSYGFWRLDHTKRILLTPDSYVLRLSNKGCILLDALFTAPGNKLSHAALAYAVFDRKEGDPPVAPDTVLSPQALGYLGVAVSRLRKKVESQGQDLPIRSVHNWGYAFAAPCQVLFNGEGIQRPV